MILTTCCHCAERKCQGLSQCDTVSFPCGKGKVPALKRNNIPALDEVLGEHDVTESDLMDIGQTFFLSVYSKNILSTAPVQDSSQKTSYTEFTAPPPPTNINLDLHNRRARLQMWEALAPEVSQIKSISRDRQLWLADCRRFASDEIYFLSFLVSSVLDIVESLRDRVVSCSASDRQGSNLESCVWRAASFHSSHHCQEASLAQFSLYVYKGGLKLPFISFSLR